MVHVFPDPTLSPAGSPIHEAPDGWRANTSSQSGRQDARPLSREEHAQRMRELNLKRGLMRTPRRGWSMTDYQTDNDSSSSSSTVTSPPDREPSIPEHAPLPPSHAPSPVPGPVANLQQLPRRPKLPPPRRSYSVTDHEPILPPGIPRPSTRLTLLDLPSELHYALLDFLDPIDSVCLGLAHPRLYPIHRRKHGRVPLSARYSGPNDREWAWRGVARPLVRSDSQPLASKEKLENDRESAMVQAKAGGDLDKLRVKGPLFCRKCGTVRCELRRHLKEWMGDGYEYCEIKEVYGAPAPEGAKPFCNMSSPKNPHRCGRHGGKKTAVAKTQ